MSKVEDILNADAAPYFEKGSKLSWHTAELPGVLGEAKAALGKGTITQEALVAKATEIVSGRLATVNQKGPSAVSAKEVERLAVNHPQTARLVGAAFTSITNKSVDVSGTQAPARPVIESKVPERSRATADGRVNDHQAAISRARGGRAAGAAPVPPEVLRAIDEMPVTISSKNMNRILDTLDKHGMPPEAVADALISGKGPIGEMFSANPKRGQHELTQDALVALTHRLASRPPPLNATMADQRQLQTRIDGIAVMAIDPRRTGVDPSDPYSPYLQGPGGRQPTIDPALYREAKAAVGPDGYIPDDKGKGFSGFLGKAWEFLKTVGGPALMITLPMLLMAAGPLAAGLPMVMGMGFPLMAAGAGMSSFASMALAPALMRLGPGAASLGALAMNFLGGGQMPGGGVGTFTPWSIPLNPSNIFGSNDMTANATVLRSGFMPTGNTMFDLSNAIANAPTYSPTEQALLNRIKDPEQRAIQELQMQMQKQALLATVITNLANMRHEMLKAVAQNLRG